MFNLFKTARKWKRGVIAATMMLGLTACDVNLGAVSGGPRTSGDAVKIALLVPYGSGTPGDEGLARSMENAARLAARS